VVGGDIGGACQVAWGLLIMVAPNMHEEQPWAAPNMHEEQPWAAPNMHEEQPWAMEMEMEMDICMLLCFF
jgi:hypothetical protein